MQKAKRPDKSRDAPKTKSKIQRQNSIISRGGESAQARATRCQANAHRVSGLPRQRTHGTRALPC